MRRGAGALHGDRGELRGAFRLAQLGQQQQIGAAFEAVGQEMGWILGDELQLHEFIGVIVRLIRAQGQPEGQQRCRAVIDRLERSVIDRRARTRSVPALSLNSAPGPGV